MPIRKRDSLGLPERKGKGEVFHIKLRYGRMDEVDIVVATVKNLKRMNWGSKTFGGKTIKTTLVKVADWIERN